MHFFHHWIQKYKNSVFGVFTTILVFILFAIIMDLLVMPIYTKNGFEVELPDITELSYEEAADFLKSNGFKMIVDTTKFNALYPESTVIAQSPNPFSLVKKGRRIYVTLSLGQKQVFVPKVTGTSPNNVRFLLEQAGLSLGEVYYEFNTYTPKNVVFRQSLADTMMAEGTPVDITVSLGRALSEIFVPDVVGKSYSLAKKMLNEAGLKLGSVSYRQNDKLLSDTILNQNPEAGTRVNQYTQIRLIVSTLENTE